MVAGLIGGLSGSGSQIRNSIFTGKIEVVSVVDALNLYKGAIIGGMLATGTSVDNINFNYWTDGTLLACGDKFITTSEKVKLIELLNKPFMTDITNFDQQSENAPFDFNTVWSLVESKYHLKTILQMAETTITLIINWSQV